MTGVRCPVLVGRERELSELTDVVAGAAAGRGGVAFVLGEAGIGKSRLLGAAGDIARSRGMTVLRGRAGQSPVPAPYRPLAEAVLSVLRGRQPEHDPSLARFASALGVLAPGVFAVEVEGAPSVVLLGEAVLALVERYASPTGAVLILEDLQWAGDETLEVVEYLSDKLEATAVALLASVRTGESSGAEWLAHGVDARRGGTVITLHRMDAEDVRAVIAASLGTPAAPHGLSEFVGEASEGVPFLVEELLAALVDAGALWRDGNGWRTAEALPSLVPSSFAVLVEKRLAGLSSPARRAIEAAAVLGERFEWRLVGRVTGVSDDEIVAALREAVAAQLVDEAAEPVPRFRFRHGLSRAAVLDTLLGPERELLARTALDVLDGDLDDSGTIPADPMRLELVADLAVIGRCSVALRALIDASAAAVRRGGCLAARRSAELALQLAVTDEETIDAREALLDVCVASGDTARAAELGRRLLIDLARMAADPQRVTTVHLQLAAAAVQATDWPRAEAHLNQAEGGVLAASAPVSARLDLLRASVALGRHDPRAAGDHARRACGAATATGDSHQLTEALLLLGRAQRVLDVEAAGATFAAALDAAHRTGSQFLLARAAHEDATLDVLYAAPTHRMDEARRLAVAVGATALTAMIDTHLCILHWLHFDLDASRTAAARALDAMSRYDLGVLAGAAGVIRASCAAAQGLRDEAVELFERALPHSDSEIESTGRGHALALAALACEDRAAAVEQLDRALALAPEFSDVARAPHCGLRALLLAVEGADEASAVAVRLDGDAAVVGVSRALTDLALAAISGRAGEQSTADLLTRRAFDALQATPWFRAIGQRLVSEAALRDGWGSPTVWLRSALDFFEAASLPEPADACRRMLRSTGAAVPRQSTRGHDPELARLGVTEREAEVLALVADGLSNREVAERLVLSVRTVEKHVERLLAKTQSANRAHLAAFATRLAWSGSKPT